MKNNSLIKYQEGFFSKLRRKFKSIFMKKSISDIEEMHIEQSNTKDSINDKIEISNEKERIENTNSNTNSNKEAFFELYKKAVNGEIDLSSIDPENLEKIYKILNEEVRIKKETLVKRVKVLEEKREIINKIANE